LEIAVLHLVDQWVLRLLEKQMYLLLVLVMQENTIMGNKKNGYSDSEMQLATTKNCTKASENNGNPIFIRIYF